MNSETHFPASPATLVIASRESRLAMWQAEHVRDALHKLYPSCELRILGMTTQGDRILDRTLSKIGGKGLFVKELETALADGRADLAVHSLKDVPMDLPEGFALAAVMEREDARDAFVSNDYASLAALPPAAWSAPRVCGAKPCCVCAIPIWWSSRCAAISTRGSRSSTAASMQPSFWPRPV